MKLIHTRANQLRRYFKRYNKVRQNRVYRFGVFYNTYMISPNKLQYNYQMKDSFSFHLMSLIKDFTKVNRIITLLNYHNCLYYNHNKFSLNHFGRHKTSYHDKQNKIILNHIFDILVWDYDFTYNVNFMFKPELDGVRTNASKWYAKEDEIIDFANQDLINMVYEIAQQNEKIEKKLTFMIIYNLLLR